MTQSTLAVGSRVRVKNVPGGAFYSHNYGKEGVVTELGDVRVAVRFDDGSSDYGRRNSVVVVPTSAKDEQGFISNRENTRGIVPVPRGTIVDVLYNDGTLILGLKAGTGEAKQSVNKPENSYSATTWTFTGSGNATIVAYRLPADRPSVKTDIKIEDMKVGMKVELTSKGDGHHEHWGMKVGEVYDVVQHEGYSRPAVKTPGGRLTRNYADWTFAVVSAPAVDVLDTELAALRAEMETAKIAITTATLELEAATQRVATKQAVVDKAQEELAALLERVAKHGLKFVEKSAQVAHDEGKLSVGVTLLAVTPEDTEEHKPGKQYKIIQRDRGDTSEWKLESEDGYGWWIRNTELKNYTVVA